MPDQKKWTVRTPKIAKVRFDSNEIFPRRRNSKRRRINETESPNQEGQSKFDFADP
jgi:hypothetical protein